MLPLHESSRTGRNQTRGHPLKLRKKRFHHSIGKNFYNRRITDVWNRLPQQVVLAPSVNAFENRLDKYWEKLDIKYHFDVAMAKENPFTATGGLSIDLR